jgi:hypothetical protein
MGVNPRSLQAEGRGFDPPNLHVVTRQLGLLRTGCQPIGSVIGGILPMEFVVSPDDIRARVARLDTRNGSDAETAWSELRPLGNAVVPYLVEAYRRAKRGEMRVVLVFHAIRFARTSDDAVALGLAALKDRATLVRHRACGLLAYSLRREVLPALRDLLTHPDARTVDDAKAAIDAIERQNHHYFVDRDHSGRVKWEVVGAGDRE